MQRLEFDSSNVNNEFSSVWESLDEDVENIDASLEDLITIMYTSGTTGNPKGAKINHMMNLFNTINVCGPARITSRTSQLVILPLFHTGGLNMYANPVLHQGGEIIIMREFNPSDALEAIDNTLLSITHLFGVPAPLQFMMQDKKFDHTNFETLEVVGVGGAPCAEIIIKNWQKKKCRCYSRLGYDRNLSYWHGACRRRLRQKNWLCRKASSSYINKNRR